jgi:hypothetical protein
MRNQTLKQQSLIEFAGMRFIINERVVKALRYLEPKEAERARRAMNVLVHQNPKSKKEIPLKHHKPIHPQGSF